MLIHVNIFRKCDKRSYVKPTEDMSLPGLLFQVSVVLSFVKVMNLEQKR